MDNLTLLFGQGDDLTITQMSLRGVVVFIFALALIRISGRRSFGIKSPLDNIIVITLGAVLSRAIVGASPFLPVIFTCITIVVLHRLAARIFSAFPQIHKFLEGEKILLFEKGAFIEENLKRAVLCRSDVMKGVREAAMSENLTDIEKVYIENSGKITVIKKTIIQS